jgi:peptidyl-prolyl cis-trans isomerase B (cyclophilin B)
MAARQAQAVKRKRTLLIVTAVGVAVLLILGIAFLVVTSGEHSTPAAKAFVAQETTGPCGYKTVDPATHPTLVNTGLPPDPTATPHSVLTVRFTTNRGEIEATLDGRVAPCDVQAVSYLIHKGFYDDTPCPRVVNGGIFIVQCGSGSDTTSSGPNFTIPDENLAKAAYTAGTIAMANSGQADSASSQFFIITKDSSAGLAKNYTVIGHVTKGLSIAQQVAAGGNDGSSGSVGGGAPKLPLVFKTVRVVKVSGGKDPGLGPRPKLKKVG